MIAGDRCEQLTTDHLKGLLDCVDTILFDCDGVLYRGNNVVDGTPDVIKKLKSMGKRILYVTNNSTRTRKQFAAKCVSMGFPATEGDIISSGYVASLYLKNIYKLGNKKVFCIGSQNLIEEFENAGLSVLKDEPIPVGEGGMQKVVNYVPDPQVGCVVVGVDEGLTYLKVGQAARYLLNRKCHFVATNLDANLPSSGNVLLPGSGSCVAMVETACERKVDVVCGKPEKMMFDVIRDKFNIRPPSTLMVGDRLDTDIAFANTCDMRSLLVLTGINSTEDVKKTRDDNLVPQFYTRSLADVSKLLQS